MGFLPTVTSRCRSCPSTRSSFCKATIRLTWLLFMFTDKQVRPAGRTAQKGPRLKSAGLVLKDVLYDITIAQALRATGLPRISFMTMARRACAGLRSEASQSVSLT